MILRDYYSLQSYLDAAYIAGKGFVTQATTATYATGYITITEAPYLISVGDTFKIGTVTFTAISGVPSVNTEFDASGTDVEAATNLASAINSHPVATHIVTATLPSATIPRILLEACNIGASGNSIDLIYTSNGTDPGASTSGDTLTGGSDATTNGEAYTTLAAGLTQAASEGKESFVIKAVTSHNPTVLRMNTKYLDAYFAGIISGLADEGIYSYECTLSLDTTDTSILRVSFEFEF